MKSEAYRQPSSAGAGVGGGILGRAVPVSSARSPVHPGAIPRVAAPHAQSVARGAARGGSGAATAAGSGRDGGGRNNNNNFRDFGAAFTGASGAASVDGGSGSSALSSLPWASPPRPMLAKVNQNQGWVNIPSPRLRPRQRRVFWAVLTVAAVLFVFQWLVSRPGSFDAEVDDISRYIDFYIPPVPVLPAAANGTARPDPVQWLRLNGNDDAADHSYKWSLKHFKSSAATSRPRAAFIALVRNSEVNGMVSSIGQLEARFNHRFKYDWIFFNDEDFTEEFKQATSNATAANCMYEKIPAHHWGVPSWIDIPRFQAGLEFMGTIGVGKAWLESYHHMCRWNAGLFAWEKRLMNYDWFWRVEPGVQFTCDIKYDVFRFMSDNDLAYGFNMAILDDARSFPSLWERTQSFIENAPELLHPESDIEWLIERPSAFNSAVQVDRDLADDTNSEDGEEEELESVLIPERLHTRGVGVELKRWTGDYNNCQFYSNFEIGSLSFFRSKEHNAYFEHLDRSGGFYYERFGDAPVHTLSVSMFLPKRQVWFFRDIGYSHGTCAQCPPHRAAQHRAGSNLALFPQDVLDLDYATTTTTGKLAEATPASTPAKDTTNHHHPSDGGALERSGDPHRRWTDMSMDLKRQQGIPALACGCTTSALDINFRRLVPRQSKQQLPVDTCIRRWLGGNWLQKRLGWDRDVEIALGGSGYDGYVHSGEESVSF